MPVWKVLELIPNIPKFYEILFIYSSFMGTQNQLNHVCWYNIQSFKPNVHFAKLFFSFFADGILIFKCLNLSNV